MKPPMLQSARIIGQAGRNEFGDLVQSGSDTVIACRYRAAATYSRGANREDDSSDGTLWANPDAPLAVNAVVVVEDEYFRVTQVIKARDFDSTTVHFLKCQLERFKESENVS
jgi:hypothetical protein